MYIISIIPKSLLFINQYDEWLVNVLVRLLDRKWIQFIYVQLISKITFPVSECMKNQLHGIIRNKFIFNIYKIIITSTDNSFIGNRYVNVYGNNSNSYIKGSSYQIINIYNNTGNIIRFPGWMCCNKINVMITLYIMYINRETVGDDGIVRILC